MRSVPPWSDLCREQQVDVRFDSKDKRIVLGNRGIQSSLPKVVHGGLSYAQETQKVIATFEKVGFGKACGRIFAPAMICYLAL